MTKSIIIIRLYSKSSSNHGLFILTPIRTVLGQIIQIDQYLKVIDFLVHLCNSNQEQQPCLVMHLINLYSI
jgi:hypothetical protein